MQKFYDLPIFFGVEKNIVEDIINTSPRQIFSAGESIIKQGEESNGKGYIIISGEVSIYIDDAYRTSLGIGDIFGEIALLNEEQRTATVQAKTGVETIILTQDSLIELINNGNYSINANIMDRIEENLKNN